MKHSAMNSTTTRLVLSQIKRSLVQDCANKLSIPTVKGLPLIGTLPALILSGGAPKLHNYVDKRHRRYGPIYRERMGNTEAVFISDPEMMRAVFANEGKYPVHVLPEAWTLYNQLFGCSRGLFFMNGEEWLHYRRVMNKFLLKGDLSYIEKSTIFIGRQFVNEIQPGIEINHLDAMLYRWSLDNIVCILLGVDTYQRDMKTFDGELTYLANTINKIFETSAKLQLVPVSFAARYGAKTWKSFVSAVDEALNRATHFVHQLISMYSRSNGLLGLMLSNNLTSSEISKIVVDLVLAAGDTTAYAMEWTLYELAKDAKLQDAIYRNKISPRNVIREILRMYPVAPFLTRILPEDTIVGDYMIPKGTLIVLSIYTSGRDRKYYAKPHKFKPTRWDNRTTDMVRASVPFAIGGRSCIGKKIAELQIENTLKCINDAYTVRLLNEEPVDIVLKMVAVPSQSIRLKFTKR